MYVYIYIYRIHMQIDTLVTISMRDATYNLHLDKYVSPSIISIEHKIYTNIWSVTSLIG